MLRRFVWSSIASASFCAPRLHEIIARSRRNNERNHVSGVLLFTGAHFVGVLEGDETDLRNLWLRLERDQRHRDLIRIADQLCGTRSFPSWTMAYVDHAAVGPEMETLRSSQAPIASRWQEIVHPILLRANRM